MCLSVLEGKEILSITVWRISPFSLEFEMDYNVIILALLSYWLYAQYGHLAI